jgi:Cu2+-exporting ATPase
MKKTAVNHGHNGHHAGVSAATPKNPVKAPGGESTAEVPPEPVALAPVDSVGLSVVLAPPAMATATAAAPELTPIGTITLFAAVTPAAAPTPATAATPSPTEAKPNEVANSAPEPEPAPAGHDHKPDDDTKQAAEPSTKDAPTPTEDSKPDDSPSSEAKQGDAANPAAEASAKDGPTPDEEIKPADHAGHDHKPKDAAKPSDESKSDDSPASDDKGNPLSKPTSHEGHDHHGTMSDPNMEAEMENDIRKRFWISLALVLPIAWLSGEIPGLPIPFTGHIQHLILFGITTPVVFYCGWMFILGSYVALRNRKLDMSVLIALGVLSAYLASIYLSLTPKGIVFYPASAMLVTFVLFGHWMEMKSRRGTSNALRALFDLVPPKAIVIRDGKEQEIATAEVVAGDTILVKSGQKIPVDGEVVSGTSAVDESLVTGESIPVEKGPGASLVGGSINTTGVLTFKATKVGNETVLAQITKLVETAQSSKAPGQRVADKAAAYLVVIAVGAGLATFLSWKFGAGVPFPVALTFAISAIVIACPDALGLATPTAVAVGIGLGAKHSVLIKDASTLEQTARLNAIIVDKTGTLTEGKPKITDIRVAPGQDESELVRVAASAEAQSSHPLAVSIIEAAKERKLDLGEVSDFENVTGLGLRANVAGKAILVGRRKLLDDQKAGMAGIDEAEKDLLDKALTLMYVAINGKFAGILAAADPVKPNAAQFVKEMKALKVEVVLMTGDNKATGEAVAKEVGIERVFSEVLPAKKAEYVKKLQSEKKFVGMVGDGINDAPALAQADIGIAIGAGTQVAIEAADIVLMRSDPLDAVNAIVLSKATVGKMKQNLIWASVYNLAAIPVAAGVFYSRLGWSLRPEVSALLMSVSSIFVAVNAVLLKRAERHFVNVGPTLGTSKIGKQHK